RRHSAQRLQVPEHLRLPLAETYDGSDGNSQTPCVPPSARMAPSERHDQWCTMSARRRPGQGTRLAWITSIGLTSTARRGRVAEAPVAGVAQQREMYGESERQRGDPP